MIKIFIGRQTDPLQEKILQTAVENYQRYPDHQTFIIVPNHIKFTTEVRAINRLAVRQNHAEQAVKNLQVLSFSRLAWFFLKDAENGLPQQLDTAAAAMILAKIVEKHQEQLHLFKNVSLNPGLLKQLYETILQIHESNFDFATIDQAELDLETKNKLADLKIIYTAFMEAIAGRFSTANEVQLQLNEYLAGQVDLQKTDFYFSDFSHFTLQECLTIKLLTMQANSVTLAFKTRNGTINPQAEAGDYDYVIQLTINRIIKYLRQHNLQFTVEQQPVNPQLSKRELVNAFWTNTISDTAGLSQVQLVKADNRYSEAYFVARTIYQQVALNHYRYHDFLVLAPNLHEYETYLTPILRQNEIPFFNDLQQEMKYHPLVVLIENIAQLLQYPLTTTNLLAVMKTRLMIPAWYQDEAAYLHDVDQLENFALAHGINHHLWRRDLNDFAAAGVIYLDQMPDEITRLERLKTYFVNQLTTLAANLTKETDTKKGLTVFFNFLTDNGVAKMLEQWRTQAQEAGDLQQARQSEQVWDLLITLLQDYLLINPSEFKVSSFFNVLINGFKEATFAQIPSTLDAVNLSETGIVQVSGYKQVFILGATNTNLPQIETTPGFLSTENLTQLRSGFDDESYLEDTQQLNNLNQSYQFGTCLALAQDKVYLSYPVNGADNEPIEPSIYYTRLKRAGAFEFNQHDLPAKQQDILSFITNPQASLGYLTYLQKNGADPAAADLLALTNERIPQETATILTASQFINEPTDIGPALAQELYGANLNSSVSQLETFYQNSYEYFLKYGLHLHKRFENELDMIQAGNYCHETFDRLVKSLQQKGLDLAEITAPVLEQELTEVRQQIVSSAKYQQLLEDPFNQFLFTCLNHTTDQVANSWRAKVQKKTPLRPKYSELSFGYGEKVHGLDLPVPDFPDHYINIRGKIDRVDLAELPEQNEALAQIIDYKSSKKDFDLGSFYSGISLQMVTYLDVIAKNRSFFTGETSLALLGAFYQTMTSKLEHLNGNNLYGSDLYPKPQLLNGQKSLQYTGLFNSDPLLWQSAEPALKQQGTTSQIYAGLRTKKDGSLFPNQKSFSNEEMELLLAYDERLIQQAAQQILAGQIKLNPFKMTNQHTALTYSDYRDIFFFDAMLKENKYHQIEKLKKETLIAKIKAELDKGE